MENEELVGKYLAGEASQDEIREVKEWRNASDSNAQEFFKMKEAWVATTPLEKPDHEVFESIVNSAPERELEVQPLWKQSSFRFAASILIVLGLVFTVIQITKDDPPYGQVVSSVTEFSLPDGSDIALQRGAMVTVNDFKEERIVNLSGTAFFAVEKNGKPFTVITGGARVEVLGTSFMVDNSVDNTTEVLVASGNVALSQKSEVFGGKSMKIYLVEGEMGQLKIGTKGIRKKKISDENYLSWKTGVLTFKKESLRDVSEKLQEVYGVGLRFENSALKLCKLTARYNKKDVDEVIDLISQTFGLTYTKTGDDYLLSGNSCD